MKPDKSFKNIITLLLIISIPVSPAASDTIEGVVVELQDGDARSFAIPPDVIAYANIEHDMPPSEFLIRTEGSIWRYNQWIALMGKGSHVEAETAVDTTSLGVQFWGDNNDGWARVLVDDIEVWTGNTYGIGLSYSDGAFIKYLELSNLASGRHTIRVENMGINGGGGGDHVTLFFFGLRKGSQAPATQSTDGITWDFETGNLIGWAKTGTAFDHQPTYGDNPTARGRGLPSKHQGNYWIGTYEKYPGPNSGYNPGNTQGDSPTGTLTSRQFIINGNKISFLIGGGSGTSVNLIVDGATVLTAHGKNTETMESVEWDVSAYKGKKALFQLVDDKSGGWGHINFDDVRFDAQPSVGRETPVPTTTPFVSAGFYGLIFESRKKPGGSTVQIPLTLKGAKEKIGNMDLILGYDPSVLVAREALKGGLTAGSLFDHNIIDGTIKISLADKDGFSGDGSVAYVVFDIIGKEGTSSPLKIASLSANRAEDMTPLNIQSQDGLFVVTGFGESMGDCTGDGEVSAADALCALQMAVGKKPEDRVMDVNNDGKVSSIDARKILRSAAGLESLT